MTEQDVFVGQPATAANSPWPARERSLADVGPTSAGSVDTSPDLPAPKDFDMESFINGVRPTRRSIQLYPQAHLIARLEQIEAQILQAPAEANVDALIDEFEQVKAQFRDGVWFTVEKRSHDWITRFRLDAEKRLGFKRTKDDQGDDVLTVKDAVTISLHQLAEQIVIPEHVSYEQIVKLREVNEGECNKLMACMIDANNQLAQQSQVVTRDFSERRSTPSAT